MLASIFNGPYGPRIINTGISIAGIVICTTLAYWFFRHKFDSKRKRHQFRSRMTYLAILIFLMVIVRIWIEGFTHIFTMMSLLAAGLVVTNKESIMNLTGWLIINWRGVFSEGDYIQIQNMTGYIDDIRLFHFKLYETCSLTNGKATGKVIKVPNSSIITNSFILFTGDTNLCLNQVTLILKNDTNPVEIAKRAEQSIQKLLEAQYQGVNAYTSKALSKKNSTLSMLINLTPSVALKLVSDKENMLSLIISYYSYPKDSSLLEAKLTESLLPELVPSKASEKT